MSRRMLGPEIEGEIAQGGFGHNGLASAAGSTPAVDCGFRIGRWGRSAAREIARLQGENATLKKELLARGLPVPGVSSPSAAKPDEPELKLPSDAEVDKVMSFLERIWRRLIEMGRDVQQDLEKKN